MKIYIDVSAICRIHYNLIKNVFYYMNNMTVEKDLKNETEKWLKKIQADRKKIRLADKSKENMLKNMDAYMSDSEHFLKKGDLIRSFEAVIWSWSILELGLELGIFSKN